MKKTIFIISLLLLSNISSAGMLSGFYDDSSDLSNIFKDIKPLTDNTYNVGSLSQRWKNTYLSGTATSDVVDTHYLEYSSGNNIIVRDNLTINGTLSTNSLTTTGTGQSDFTSGILLSPSTYVSWGAIYGLTGYGLRDNAGTIEVKNSGESFSPIISKSTLNWKDYTITLPTATSDLVLGRVPYAITIKNIHLQCTGGTNIVGMLEEWDSNGANLVAVIDSPDLTATAGTDIARDTTLSHPNVASGDYMYWRTTSVSGTVTSATITYYYTIN